MCYLVAKKYEKEGSLVLEVEQGQRLASLLKNLTLTTLGKGIQKVTLNDLESFKEYFPYTVIDDEVEYISKVVKM
ncbi:DUF6718 family protein [Clostridium tagluense]|uniref:DUF6718 family protein n=1 Tax=Clostridium tagluense TaxID=360422 RepID=UPI0027D9A0C3|nr:DUF6718 family protein [Clostridium tagluense]